jgi:hypothetical protein
MDVGNTAVLLTYVLAYLLTGRVLANIRSINSFFLGVKGNVARSIFWGPVAFTWILLGPIALVAKLFRK